MARAINGNTAIVQPILVIECDRRAVEAVECQQRCSMYVLPIVMFLMTSLVPSGNVGCSSSRRPFCGHRSHPTATQNEFPLRDVTTCNKTLETLLAGLDRHAHRRMLISTFRGGCLEGRVIKLSLAATQPTASALMKRICDRMKQSIAICLNVTDLKQESSKINNNKNK
eukprot:6486606-Amphidinium_carterae.1